MGQRLANDALRSSDTHPGNGFDPDEWFCPAAITILGKQAGLQLHLLTGYPLSSCGYYLARDSDKRRPAPDHLVRKLIHSEQGEPWHRAYMHGCKAQWWLNQQRRLNGA
jgi:hypothetical protein